MIGNILNGSFHVLPLPQISSTPMPRPSPAIPSIQSPQVQHPACISLKLIQHLLRSNRRVNNDVHVAAANVRCKQYPLSEVTMLPDRLKHCKPTRLIHFIRLLSHPLSC